MGNSTAFSISLNYADADGNALTGSAALVNDTATVSTWTHVRGYLGAGAPPGTVSVTLVISMTGTTSGSPLAYIDDMQFYVA
jgi:hypothetical protein